MPPPTDPLTADELNGIERHAEMGLCQPADVLRLVAMARRGLALEQYIREDDRYCPVCCRDKPFDHMDFTEPVDVDALIADYLTPATEATDEH